MYAVRTICLPVTQFDNIQPRFCLYPGHPGNYYFGSFVYTLQYSFQTVIFRMSNVSHASLLLLQEGFLKLLKMNPLMLKN